MTEERREWLSTGQAARFCSVRPDTILKWIKRGRLRAERTPGGHYRIRRGELEPHILTPAGKADRTGAESYPAQLLRCWEYLGSGSDGPTDECRQCIVYRSRASLCFQMVELAREMGHGQRHCRDTCEDCSYYQRVRGMATGVLIVTSDIQARDRLEADEHPDLRLQFATTGYTASAVIHDFRPAFVIVDCALLKGEDAGLIDRLSEDPRLPGVRIVLAVGKGRAARVRASIKRETVVGVLEKPLRSDQIASVIEAFPVETQLVDGAGA